MRTVFSLLNPKTLYHFILDTRATTKSNTIEIYWERARSELSLIYPFSWSARFIYKEKGTSISRSRLDTDVKYLRKEAFFHFRIAVHLSKF